MQVYYRLFIYIYVMLLEIQLSRERGWDPINWFNPAILLCLSQAKTWISNIIYHGLISSMKWGEGWLFIMLIMVKLLTIIVKLSFHNNSFHYGKILYRIKYVCNLFIPWNKLLRLNCTMLCCPVISIFALI